METPFHRPDPEGDRHRALKHVTVTAEKVRQARRARTAAAAFAVRHGASVSEVADAAEMTVEELEEAFGPAADVEQAALEERRRHAADLLARARARQAEAERDLEAALWLGVSLGIATSAEDEGEGEETDDT